VCLIGAASVGVSGTITLKFVEAAEAKKNG
jgi:hypothetical protein